MKQSPVRILLILLFTFIGCFGVAYAAAGMLTALPAPAIGGTCGPSTGSETAGEALARPGSIGAGPEPAKSNVTAHHQWQTFIQQCQALADRRGLASAAILVISLAVAGIGLFWVLRKPRQDGNDTAPELDEETAGPAYTPLGLHDPAALVGAGTVVGAPGTPVVAWPSSQPPVYGAPPAYPAPSHPGAPAEGGYAQQAWQAQPPGSTYPGQPPVYPPPGQAYPTESYPGQAYPTQPSAYPPAYPPQGQPGPAPAYQTTAPQPDPYPQPTYPPQGQPEQGQPPQGQPAQGQPEQGHTQQSWPAQPPQAPPVPPQYGPIGQDSPGDAAPVLGAPGPDVSAPVAPPSDPTPDGGAPPV